MVADLPCSGLGVLGKKTDLKYKMTEETQKELVALQRKMLSTVKDYVKPGRNFGFTAHVQFTKKKIWVTYIGS